jgi:hypothetical protein
MSDYTTATRNMEASEQRARLLNEMTPDERRRFVKALVAGYKQAGVALDELHRLLPSAQIITAATTRAFWAAEDIVGMRAIDFIEHYEDGDMNGLTIIQQDDGSWLLDEDDYAESDT